MPAQETKVDKIFFVDDGMKKELLGQYVYVLEDKTGKLTLDSLMHQKYSSKWILSQKNIPSFGYSSSSFWFRIDISFERLNKNKLPFYSLVVQNPLLDTLVFYKQQGEKYEANYYGDLFPFYDRPLHHPDFVLDFIPDQKRIRLFFNVRGASSISLPLVLWEFKSFFETNQDYNLLLGLYLGILLILIFYNLYIYFVTWDKIYLYYILCVFSVLILILALTGMGYQYIWPASPIMQRIMGVISACLTSFFTLQFSRKFLHLESLSHFLNIFSKWSTTGWGILILLIPFLMSAEYFSFIVALSTLNMFFTLIIGIISYLKGYQPARFFMIGWLFFLFWLILFASAHLGLVGMNFLISNGFYFGITFGLTFISVAMADKIRIINKIREKAQEKLIRLLDIDREKNQMINVISHDLKSPLNQIKGFVSLIRYGKELDKDQQDFLGQISDSANRLTSLVNKVLDTNSLDAQKLNLKIEPTDVSLIIDKALKNLHPTALNKNQTVIKEYEDEKFITLVDADYFMQILDNLLSNASKFSQRGDSIFVNVIKNNGFIKITIRDSGPGISQSDQKNLFFSYQKLSAKPTGEEGSSGLGLAIVKKYVEIMNGTIICKSALGEGTSFIMEFESPDTQNLNQGINQP